jgi:hypothetical protein
VVDAISLHDARFHDVLSGSAVDLNPLSVALIPLDDTQDSVVSLGANEAIPNTSQVVPNFPQYRRTGRSAKNAHNATIKAIPRRIDQKKRT